MDFNVDEEKYLTPGIHEMTWKEFYDTFSFSERRKELLEGLEKIVVILQEIGDVRIYIDGSFVTSEKEPGDWDACYEFPLSLMDTLIHRLAKVYPLYNKKEQKRLYKGELYYAHSAIDMNRDISYLNFFQQIRNKPELRKGIVELID